ncbi:MAG TPA: BON domain-containing protein [Rhodanobacteraceae bacterium]|nr:BON domain-containing protein [Rhodanobacteraceae bacterium]
MKTRIAAAIVASMLVGPLGAAYAQQTPPPQSASTSASMGSNGQSSQSMSSDQVEQKIKHALTSHGVTATHVTVTFNDGTATLSGTVYNQRDIAKAKKAAMRVRGVKQVDTSGLHARGSQAGHTQG